MHHVDLDISIVLFGSHKAGNARPDSDYDVLLVGEEFVRHVVPQPLPFDEPGFYGPSIGAAVHHKRKHDWSVELWNRLGGDPSIAKFRQLATKHLRHDFDSVSEDDIDLFLHIPCEVSPTVWSIQLAWEDAHAHWDFACEAAQNCGGQFPQLLERQTQILASQQSANDKAIDLEQALKEMAGISIADTYRDYRSLCEMKRCDQRYQEVIAQIGPV